MRPYLAGFSAYRDAEISPWLEVIADRHRATKRHFIFHAAIILGLMVFVATMNSASISAPFEDYLPIINVILILGLLLAVYSAHRQYVTPTPDNNQVRTALLRKICQFLGFSHDPTGNGFPFTRFMEASLFPYYEQYKIANRIAGTYEKTAFSMWDVKLTRSLRQGTEVVFEGIMLACQFQKRFTGKTIIKCDGGSMGNLFRLRDDVDRVFLEDWHFENRFAVFSSDQVEARYLLTPRFMERLFDLSSSFHEGAFEAAFLDGQLLLAVDLGPSPVDGKGEFASPNAPREIRKLVERACFPPDLIDMLQLASNTNA